MSPERPSSIEIDPATQGALWREWLSDGLARGLPLSEDCRERFERLYALLLAHNENVNLTRIIDLRDFLVRHLLESLLISPYLPEGVAVVDVGTGAGFPALPLAMTRPDLRVCAVESIGKKCAFIEEMKTTFALENLQVVNARSEDLGRDAAYRERFDLAMARAVAPLPVLLELVTPLVEPGGAFLAIKGAAWREEADASARAQTSLNVRLRAAEPMLDHAPSYTETQKYDSILLLFDKFDATPAKYPRQAGIPRKKPL